MRAPDRFSPGSGDWWHRDWTSGPTEAGDNTTASLEVGAADNDKAHDPPFPVGFVSQKEKKMDESERIVAPWDADTIAALETWQAHPMVHPYTCPADGTDKSVHHSDRRILIPTELGWHCPFGDCQYTQNWAHSFSVLIA